MTNPDYEMHLRPEEDYEMHFEDAGLKPEQTATVTPTYEEQTVRPDPGCVFSEVTVEAIPEPTEEIDITENGTVDVARYGVANVAVPVGVFPEGTEDITKNGDYDVTLKETAHVEVLPDLQNKTVTPTEQTQTVEADTGYDGLDAVTVNPIPPEYVIPTGSVDITANGQVSVSGKATANVNVPQGVFPSGTKVITQNVTGEDVTNYAAVDVAVPGPSGTKQINITANGTTTEDVTDYAAAEIMVDTDPEKGLVFEDYDSDGFPHRARLLGNWTKIENRFLPYSLGSTMPDTTPVGIGKKIIDFTIPEGVTEIEDYGMIQTTIHSLTVPETLKKFGRESCSRMYYLEEITFPPDVQFSSQSFMYNVSLQRIYFEGDISGGFPTDCFRYRDMTAKKARVLVDFSHCTKIPVLSNSTAMDGSNGCVFRIPYALSDEALGAGNGWQSATNWVAKTYVVWEVV